MNCQYCKEHLIEYIEELLEDQQCSEIASHIESCSNCRAEAARMTDLRKRLLQNGQTFAETDLENAVFDRIVRSQHLKIKEIRKIDRQFNLWRIIMKSKIAKFATAAVLIVAVFLTANIFNNSIPTASAAQVLQDAVDAVSGLWSVHMNALMRTRPADNFSNIGLDYDLVEIEMWKRTNANNQTQWRVEKPGRVLLMDGQTTIMFIQPNLGVLQERALPLGCYDSWSGRLLNVHDLLDNELQKAKNDPSREVSLWHQEVEGKDKIVLEIDVITDLAEDDYLRNKFISESDRLKVYRFDAETKLLESLQIYVHTEDEDVLIFEVTNIEYNTEIEDGVFALDLPEDMIWTRGPQILPDNERYENMTPQEAAETFFHACSQEDWEEALKFWMASRIDDRIKDLLGGLEIISLGEPFQSDGYHHLGWFVPYEIRLRSGEVRKQNLAIRKDNPAKRFRVDGGL